MIKNAINTTTPTQRIIAITVHDNEVDEMTAFDTITNHYEKRNESLRWLSLSKREQYTDESFALDFIFIRTG